MLLQKALWFLNNCINDNVVENQIYKQIPKTILIQLVLISPTEQSNLYWKGCI